MDILFPTRRAKRPEQRKSPSRRPNPQLKVPHPAATSLPYLHPPQQPVTCYSSSVLQLPPSRPQPPRRRQSQPANPGWSSSPLLLPSGQLKVNPQPVTSGTRIWNQGSMWNSTTNLTKPLSNPAKFVQDVVHFDAGKLIPHTGGALLEQISSSFDSIINLIDEEVLKSDDGRLVPVNPSRQPAPSPAIRGGGELVRYSKRDAGSRGIAANSLTSIINTSSYFTKASLYANSHLPASLPHLTLPLPAHHLVCLAAQYSRWAYSPPRSSERESHIAPDWRQGTKAMVMKSVQVPDPMSKTGDFSTTIVFAIRGSQSFMDWATNLNSEPASPKRFLDDEGNLVHGGFLSVARRMLEPVTKRLRELLALQSSGGSNTVSLLITGHSAGGAVAALLYSHLLSTQVSGLTALIGQFRRIHCITFGAPPVSLLPLQKPSHHLRHPRLLHPSCLFLSFVNEGDPVARADKSYLRSLLDLYASPQPGVPCPLQKLAAPLGVTLPSFSALQVNPSAVDVRSSPKKKSAWALLARPNAPRKTQSRPAQFPPPYWPVPPSTLSNAGTLVVLRASSLASSQRLSPRQRRRKKGRGAPRGGVGLGTAYQDKGGQEEEVWAHLTTDEQLRHVVWGDPVAHLMRLYQARVEALALEAWVLEEGRWGW